MLISDISIRRPVFTTMVAVGLMTLGALALRSLSVDLIPDVSFPIVTIVTVYPGAGPEEVEQQVTKKIEEVVSSVNGVDQVFSTSRDSVSVVTIQFKLETEVKTAATDVREKVAAIRTQMPSDIEDPLIQRFDPTAAPILTYSVSSSRGAFETRRIVEDVIKPRIESVDGVAAVSIYGGLEREVKIFLDRGKLESLNLSLPQIAQQLRTEGFDLPAGRITAGPTEVNVKTMGRYRSLEELGNVVVGSLATGSQVRLKEVARIEDSFKDVRTLPRLDGADAVTFEIQKQGGTNTVAIADGVYKAMDQLAKILPGDVKTQKVIDSSVFIRRNISEVSEAIIFGGAMAILVIYLFMLDWRSTFISALSLPTSVITTFLVMDYLGFSLNIMSLLGLSLAIGLLIDDAVVVRENIFRHMEMGEDPITAARRGTHEIGLAVMATTFTVVAVFVPVGFMGGLVGRFFKQFGLTVAAAVLVSLFISFTLDPMMSARVMKPVLPDHHDMKKKNFFFRIMLGFYEGMDRSYRDLLGWSLRYKWLVALGAAALFFGSISLTRYMGSEFVPVEDRGEFKVLLEMPSGISLAEMDKVTRDVEALVRGNEQVRGIYTVVGPGENVNKAHLRVFATKLKERPGIRQADIEADIRKRLAAVPGLTYSIGIIGLIEGPAQEYPVSMYLRADDNQLLQEWSDKVFNVFKGIRGMGDLDMSYRGGKPESYVTVDRSAAADRGVSAGMVAQTIRLAIEGDVVGKYRQGDRDYDIRVQLPEQDRSRLDTVKELLVPATGSKLGVLPMGPPGPVKMYRVSELSRVESATGPATINRQNRQRQVLFTANPVGRPLGDIVSEIEVKMKEMNLPPGLRYGFVGQTERMQETFENMLLALFVAVLFIYFVLASQFESFIHPFTIMVTLPLAMVGAFVILFLTGWSLSLFAMIGIVLLMGLVTKNGILLVDFANQLRDKGHGVEEALLIAGPTRLRPILMTSAAMVLGMLPTALGRGEGFETRAPMALAVIGGVITSTVLTLVVIPVVYVWMDKLSLGRSGLREDFTPEAPPPAPAE